MSQCHWQLLTRLGLPYVLSKIAFARASCDVEEALLVYHQQATSKLTVAIATWLHLASPGHPGLRPGCRGGRAVVA